MVNAKVLGIVLAGGVGKRLAPLTEDRAKPAVPFGGIYRLVDFVLSNLVNGGYLRLAVLTQYKSHSLDRHITTTWRVSSLLGDYITSVPAQQRLGPRWYAGSADAIYQSLNLVYDEEPDIIAVFGADHVYRMNTRQIVRQHIESGAGVTVAGIRVPRKEAWQFGIIQTAPDGRKIEPSWRSRPTRLACPTRPTRPTPPWATTSSAPTPCSRRCGPTPRTSRPSTTWAVTSCRGWSRAGDAQVYDFATNEVPGATRATRATGATSGRSTPTTRPTWTSSRRCRSSTSTTWSGRSTPASTLLPPAKIVNGGQAPESMLCNGVIVTGGTVYKSVLSPRVRVEEGASVEGSVIMHRT